MSEKATKMKLRTCPWCGWRSAALWVYRSGEDLPRTPAEYSVHCNHCGYAGRKSRFKWRAQWNWNHMNVRRKKGKRYHLYGREF